LQSSCDKSGETASITRALISGNDGVSTGILKTFNVRMNYCAVPRAYKTSSATIGFKLIGMSDSDNT